MTLQKKLKLNGREVNVMANQMIFDWDFSGLNMGEEKEECIEATPPAWRKRPECVCGAKHTNIQPYMRGHSDWCEVHEDKTPWL